MQDAMTKFYQTEQFRKLNQKWKKALKDSGFTDIEDEADPDLPLPPAINRGTARFRDMPAVTAHYDAALHLLNHGTFDSKAQKRIWELYTTGASERMIASRMDLSKSAVHYHLEKCKKRMI